MINLQNMVNFPSVGYSWLSASFADCLACPGVASMFAAYMCVCARVHVFMHANICLRVHHPCNHLHDGLIGLAAEGPKASAA